MKFLLTIPVHNEASIIQDSLQRLSDFLVAHFSPDQYRVVVSDNASNDETGRLIQELLPRISNTEYLFIPQKGKGIAIASAWEKHINGDFDLFVFMDADLATDLEALPRLVTTAQNADLTLGDRYHRDSVVERTFKRRFVSRGYRMMIRALLSPSISDYPCGFKGIKKDALVRALALTRNRSWFFDSELAFWVAACGGKCAGISVRWRDPRPADQKSKVKILPVSWQYLKEIFRLRKRRAEMDRRLGFRE